MLAAIGNSSFFRTTGNAEQKLCSLRHLHLEKKMQMPDLYVGIVF